MPSRTGPTVNKVTPLADFVETSATRFLGIKSTNTLGLVRAIQRGLPYKTLKRCSDTLDVPQEKLGVLLGISRRTLARRKLKQRFESHESDRILRLARIITMAITFFEGDEEAAREWLASSQYALGGFSPLQLSTLDVGAREVEALILRLEHGIPL